LFVKTVYCTRTAVSFSNGSVKNIVVSDTAKPKVTKRKVTLKSLFGCDRLKQPKVTFFLMYQERFGKQPKETKRDVDFTLLYDVIF